MKEQASESEVLGDDQRECAAGGEHSDGERKSPSAIGHAAGGLPVLVDPLAPETH